MPFLVEGHDSKNGAEVRYFSKVSSYEEAVEEATKRGISVKAVAPYFEGQSPPNTDSELYVDDLSPSPDSESTNTEPRRCHECGAVVSDRASFCPECGLTTDCPGVPVGFWTRTVALIVDGLVLLPLLALTYPSVFRWKNLPLAVFSMIPSFLYKPFMESRYGATLGKRLCLARVVNAEGERLSLGRAYLRNVPYLAPQFVAALVLISAMVQPQFASNSFVDANRLLVGGGLYRLKTLLGYFFMVDCLFAAFTQGKRALHDYLADSWCIYQKK